MAATAALSELIEQPATCLQPVRLVQVGQRQFDPRDVVSVNAYGLDERDIDGQIFGFALFLLAATIAVLGVVVFGWRERFLIFTAMIGAIGFMSLQDVLLTRPVRIYRLDVKLRNGETISFADPNQAVILQMRDALAPLA